MAYYGTVSKGSSEKNIFTGRGGEDIVKVLQ
jgi:hypothetical protein